MSDLKPVYRETHGYPMPFLIFYQTTPGTPSFRSYPNLESAAVMMEHLGSQGLRPQLYHLVDRIEEVKHEEVK